MLNNLLFFISGVLTIISFIAILNLYKRIKKSRQLVMTQSLMYSTAKIMFPMLFEKVEKARQSYDYDDTKAFRYVELLDKAYWIERNKIYYTDISGGRFDPDKKVLVKTKNLPEEEVRKLLFIISSLKNNG